MNRIHLSHVAPQLVLLALCVVGALSLSGCLMVESKEYTFHLNSDGSGTGRIVFRNIGSISEDTTDYSVVDYKELLEDYLHGKSFEDEHYLLENVTKRIYQNGDQLDGEISFTFGRPSDVGLYRYKDTGPWMLYGGKFKSLAGEKIAKTNGTYGGEEMPVIFWDADATDFTVKTDLGAPGRNSTSLLKHYLELGTASP